MRLKRFALLLTATSIAVSGCTASRYGSSAPGSGGGDFSAGAEYDTDPPMQQNRSRMAIQPRPVPPAQGVSHVRGVSFLTVLKGSDHNDNCCDAPNCAAPEEAVCVPEKACGESFFQRSRCWSGLFCPTKKDACVPEANCEESYCQPLIETPCGDEGCTAKSSSPCRRFFTSFTGKMKKFSFCRRGSACGEGCVAQYSQECGDEGCVTFGRREHSMTPQQNDGCRAASPLAAPLADPFVEHGTVETPPAGVPTAPREFEGGKAPHEQPVPPAPQPVKPNNAAPLNPVPNVPNDQAMVEPQVWPKLKVDNVPSEEWSTPQWTQRPQTANTHPTGWRRR